MQQQVVHPIATPLKRLSKSNSNFKKENI